MDGAYYVKPSLWRRLMGKLFPSKPLPDVDAQDPHFEPGYCSLYNRIEVDWIDRLRLLVSGKACLDIAVQTDKPLGAIKARSVFYVEAP